MPAPRSCCWRQGPKDSVHVDQHPGRLHQAAQQPEVQLELRERAGAQSWPTAASRSRAAAPLGGSSSINGMLYVRGNPLDYNTWSQFGNIGWALRVPCCRISARPNISRRAAMTRADAAARSTSTHMRDRAELLDAFIDAAVDEGVPAQQGLQQRPSGRLRLFPGDPEERRALVDARAGFWTRPAAGPNLKVETEALTPPVLILDGKRAVGVAYTPRQRADPGGTRQPRGHPGCRRGEVAASPRAVRHRSTPTCCSPRSAFPVVHALPGVGENYRDHYAPRMNWRVKLPVTLNEQQPRPRRWRRRW